jgi:DNA-binding PadR family transcriptional regulator
MEIIHVVPPQPDDFLPLTHLLYAVLLALVEQPSHPYELVKRVRESSSGRIDPGTGSFYSVLAQAERQGLIRQRPNPEARRRVYELAPFGRRVLAAEAERLAEQVRATRVALVPDKKRT